MLELQSQNTNGNTKAQPKAEPAKLSAKEQAAKDAAIAAKFKAALGDSMSDAEIDAIIAKALEAKTKEAQEKAKTAQENSSKELRRILSAPENLTFSDLISGLQYIKDVFGEQSEVRAALMLTTPAKRERAPRDPNAPKAEAKPSTERALTTEDKTKIAAWAARQDKPFKTGEACLACGTTSRNTGIYLAKLVEQGALTSEGVKGNKTFSRK